MSSHQTHFHLAELWRIGYRPLYHEVGERRLIIIVTAGVSSIYQKTKALEQRLNAKSVWLNRSVLGMRHIQPHDVLVADVQSVVKLWRMRRDVENVIAFMVHAAVSHTAVKRLKELIPGIRIISYVYDFLDHFIPEDQKELWAEYHGSPERARIEYPALKAICRGEIADGVAYKDYGPGWCQVKDSPLYGLSRPNFWLPQTPPESMFQTPPQPDVAESFVYIGTIVPKSTHDRPSKIFADIMMEDIFSEVEHQGYPIHAYVMQPHPEVFAEYLKLFRGRRVNLFNGETLEFLLPRLAQRYKWGWMMYHYPQPMIMPIVRTTLPTKLFTYLALGIPPVVSEEMAASCRLVKKYGCGVIVSQDQIQHLPDVLAAQDYPRLLHNVLKAREQLKLEKFMDGLADFFDRVQQKKAITVETMTNEQSYDAQQPAPAPRHVCSAGSQ